MTIEEKRYKDLQDYFSDKDCAKTILENDDEFKKWLERLKWYVKKCDELAMELKALEKEPCEDAISRQKVLELVADYDLSMGQVVDGIHALPPVTPQPKIGRWVMSDDGLYRPICNNCGAHPWKGYVPTVEEATEVFKYCPNCGAKMQEVEG